MEQFLIFRPEGEAAGSGGAFGLLLTLAAFLWSIRNPDKPDIPSRNFDIHIHPRISVYRPETPPQTNPFILIFHQTGDKVRLFLVNLGVLTPITGSNTRFFMIPVEFLEF